jgi:cytochrome c biogenesis protein CcmG, thiol:disulfide interchange protein DsbE
MTAPRPAALATGSCRIGARGRRLLCGLLLLAAAGPATAQTPPLTPLLRELDLRGYPAGTMAPGFNGSTLGSEALSLSGLRGKVVVLNFWATWCLECRPEMPVLEQIHREFAPRGLAVIGINTREASRVVRRYATDLGLTFPLVLDPDGRIGATYGVVGLPTTFIVARDGTAVALAVGAREWASAPARAIIDALLAEPAPRRSAR